MYIFSAKICINCQNIRTAIFRTLNIFIYIATILGYQNFQTVQLCPNLNRPKILAVSLVAVYLEIWCLMKQNFKVRKEFGALFVFLGQSTDDR